MRAIGFIAAALVLTTACGRGYSEVDRAGVVLKFSEKGLVWKSWEGELNLGGMRSEKNEQGAVVMVANTWLFSVKDPRVVPEITQALENGDHVRLHYVQWVLGPVDMSTGYEVTHVVARKAATR